MFLKRFLKNSLKDFKQIRTIKTKSLKFKANGEPIDVLNMVEEDLPQPKESQVLVKVLMAPINPSDVNIIQGRYPLQPDKPATAGTEFVGKIIERGEKVEQFTIDERIVAYEYGLGSWTNYMILNEDQIFQVPYSIDLPEAATLTINPCTAYRMLKDFVKLKAGDCVIQNGANSAVGQAVHQLCKNWGIKSIGIVRDRPDFIIVKQQLQRFGATEILTEEELNKTEIFKTCLPKPLLALDCVGGECATNIAKFLDHKGIMVTYGGMSRKPFTISAGPLIFKKHAYHGFWITDWSKLNYKSLERVYMLNNIIDLMANKNFVAPPHTLIPFEKYEEYAKEAFVMGNKKNTKYIFDMTQTQTN